MKAIQFLSILALTTATAIRRDAATIQKDLSTINSDLNSLYSACNGWNGQASTVTPINNAEKKLETDLKTANTDAANSGAISSADSKTIVTYINGTVEPDLAKALTCLSGKKAQFKAANLLTAQVAELKTLKNLTETYGATLIGKASSDQRSSAQSAGFKIDSDFTNAINTLSS